MHASAAVAIRVGGRTGTAHNPTERREWGTSPSWARSVTVELDDFSRGRMSGSDHRSAVYLAVFELFSDRVDVAEVVPTGV